MIRANQYFKRSPGTESRKKFLPKLFRKGAPSRTVDRAFNSVLTTN